MIPKLYYLTRSYYPYQKGGGSLMRTGAVKYLQELGWKVVVVIPHYGSNKLNIENNIIQIPQKYNIKLNLYLERLGLREDYLDIWVEEAFEYLKNKVKKDDILFATSGGELGMMKLAFLLKKKVNCKAVVNFRDPLDYSIVNDLKLDNKFHISREKQEKKYLGNADLIITSSTSNQKSLQNKYSYLKDKIINNYFGYIYTIDTANIIKISSDKLRVAYVGNMGSLQSPEILFDIYKKLENINIEVYFIGNIDSNKKLQNIKKMDDKNIVFIDFLPHDKFLKFMYENMDIGFVSLVDDYLGACVPSKIYEYINLELPIFGALPNGDGIDIINHNEYGIACMYNDINSLAKGLEQFLDNEFLQKCKENILKDKDIWYMKNKMNEVDILLKNLVDEN